MTSSNIENVPLDASVVTPFLAYDSEAADDRVFLSSVGAFGPGGTGPKPIVRKEFPESWIWDLFNK